MYKDSDRQRRAVREATRRYRARLKGITPQKPNVIPCDTRDVIPKQSINPMMVGYEPPRKE